MATLADQIVALASLLSPEEQQQVLEFMQELATKKATSKPELPPGTSGSSLRNVHFSMSAEEADTMWRAIMEDRERSIDDDETCNHGQF